jgi:purine-binding chemotaxis protein CheW
MSEPVVESRALDESREYVTFEISGRLFGAEVKELHDVFTLQGLTPVPLARHDLAGLINLRGRIVTVIDGRKRLGLCDGSPREQAPMAIGIERDGESYGLVIDAVGEVLRLADEQFEPTPGNLDENWRDVALGVFRLKDGLLVALDIAKMLDAPPLAQAA